MEYYTMEQLQAVIQELEWDVAHFKRVLETTTRNQCTENYTNYEGRKEAYASIIEYFEGLIREYKFEIEDRKDRGLV